MNIVNFYKNYEITTLYITRKQLLNLSFHLGHKKKNWLKVYNLYILGYRLNYVIFNIDYILYYLNRVVLFLNELFYKYGRIFMISHMRNRGFIGLSYFFFKKLKYGGFYDGKYIGGLIFNFFVLKQIKKKKKLQYHINFFGFKYFLPSTIVVLDSNEFYSCFFESLYFGIPSIGVVDSDLYYGCFYPIFGNNESFFFSIYILIYIYFLKKKNIFLRKLRYYLFIIDIFKWILIYKIYLICIKYKKYDFLVYLFKKYYNYMDESLNASINIYMRIRTFKFLKKMLLIRINIYRNLIKNIKYYKYNTYQRKLKIFFKKKVKLLSEYSLFNYFLRYENFETPDDHYLKLKEYFEYGYKISYRWDFKIWKYNRLSDLTYRYYTNDEIMNYYDNWFKKIEKRSNLSGFVRYHFKEKERARITYYKLYLRLLSFVYGRQYLFILIYKILKRNFKLIAAKILMRRHRKLKPIKYFFKRYIFQFFNIYKNKAVDINVKSLYPMYYYVVNYPFFTWSFLNKYYLRLLILNRSMAKQFAYKYRTYLRKTIRYIFRHKGKVYRTHFFYNKTLASLYINDFKLVITVLRQFLKKGKFNLIFMVWTRFKKFLVSYMKKERLTFKNTYFYKYDRKKKKKLIYFFYLYKKKKKKLLLKLYKIYCFGLYTYNINFKQFF